MGGRPRRSASARAAAILTLAVIACAPPAGAGAATQVGETFVPQNNCDPGATHLQSSSPGDGYTVGFRGVITSWSHRAGPSPGQVKLKVGRPLGGNSFRILAESGFFAPTAGSLLNVPAQIPVLPGDVIGSYVSNAACGRSALGTGYLAHYLYPGDPAPGTTPSFLGPAQYQVDIAAVLEPDCDNDGFGDESQDQNLDGCPPGPAATITSGPKNKVKTRKNRATATFTFTADDPGATFNCTLDGKQELEPCVSPLTVTVRRGEHTFSVTATDAGGNAGAAATDTFKVKRKRKKK
jgi:hypothetical protein